MLNKINFIIKGGEVKRFHTIKTIQEETNGHHSFLVAMLCELLSPGRPTLLLAALTHDLAEHIVGDVPSPVKSLAGAEIAALENSKLVEVNLYYEKGLTQEERRTLTLADRLAGLIFCRRELRMGNVLIVDCHHNYYELVKSMEPFNEEEAAVINPIIQL